MNKAIKILLFLFLPVSIFAQVNYTNPYSFIGVGQPERNSYSRNGLMGGAGVAMESKGYINNLNPASLNSLDSLGFYLNADFDIGISSWNVDEDSYSFNNSRIKYFAFGFRVNNRWALSMGINPYSNTGYMFSEIDNLNREIYYERVYEGSGGLSSVYWSNSLALTKGISVGAKISYLYGNQSITESVYPVSSDVTYVNEEKRYLNGFHIEYGILAKQKINRSVFSAGLTFSNKTDIDYRADLMKYIQDWDTLENESGGTGQYTLPMNYTAGVAYELEGKLKLAFDYSRSAWGQTNNGYGSISVMDEERYAAGIQINPLKTLTRENQKTLGILAGGWYSTGYLSVSGKNVDTWGATLGVEIPIGVRKLSSIFMGYEFEKTGFSNKGWTSINNHNLKIGLAFHDFWFMKRRFD